MDAQGLTAPGGVDPEAHEEITDSEELLRAVGRLRKDAETGVKRPHWRTFITKRIETDGAISVDRLSLTAVVESLRRWQAKDMPTEGIVTIEAQTVRRLGLDAEPRPTRKNPSHAAITGLPYYQDDAQRGQAKQIAWLLRDHCAVAWEAEGA